jgi:hypothetical protein
VVATPAVRFGEGLNLGPKKPRRAPRRLLDLGKEGEGVRSWWGRGREATRPSRGGGGEQGRGSIEHESRMENPPLFFLIWDVGVGLLVSEPFQLSSGSI